MPSHCPHCGRTSEHVSMRGRVERCSACGGLLSSVTGLPVIEGTVHCAGCGALVYQNMTVRGLGVTCGCAGKDTQIQPGLFEGVKA